MEKALNAQLAVGLGSGHRRFPPDLVSLQRAYNGEWRTEIGPEATFSSTGPQVDENGNPVAHNYIPNSEGVGGAPGVLPTGWSFATIAGMTIACEGGGSGYANFRISGTNSGASDDISIRFAASNGISAVPGQAWNLNFDLVLVSGSLPAAYGATIYQRDAAQAYLAGANASQLFEVQLASAVASTAYVQPVVRFRINASTTHNFVVRISRPQLSKSAVKLPYVPTYGSAAFAPSITDNGLAAMGAWTNLLTAGSVDLTNDGNSTAAATGGITTFTEVGLAVVTRYMYGSNVSYTSGLTYTFSRKVKIGGRRFVQLTTPSAQFGTVYANFDLQNALVTAASGCTGSISTETDGYYTLRLTAVATATGSGVSCVMASIPAGDSGRLVSSAGINGIAYYTKHAMCVQSAYLFPYCPPGVTVPASSSTTGNNGPVTPMTPGTWESVTDGVELVVNGSGDSTIGWNALVSASLSSVSGRLRVTNTIVGYGKISQPITTVIGQRYKLYLTMYQGTSARVLAYRVGTTDTGVDVVVSTAVTSGVATIAEFTAITTTTYITFAGPDALGEYFEIDNISIQRIVDSVYVPSKGDKMLKALRGETDVVELWNNATAAGTNWSKTGTIWTHAAGSTTALNIASSLTIGQRYKFSFKVTAGTAGTVTPKAGQTSGTAVSATGTYVEELLCSSDAYIRFTPSLDFNGGVEVYSIQRLLPSVFTACALVYVGAGSGELATTTSHSIFTPNSSVFYGQYIEDAGGVKRIANSYDGTSVALREGTTWNRDEIHLKCVQTNAAGTQFRVGNRRYTSTMVPIDSLTWSAWIAYDGSQNPLTHLRLALNGVIPLWFRMVSLSKKSLSDTEILNQLIFVPRHLAPLEMVDSLQMLDTLEMI